jgi:2'-5' RNA ligase
MRSRFMREDDDSRTALTYWLLPAQPAREFFRETIGRLAAECDAPLFEPHLTLAVGPESMEQAQRILSDVAVAPIELHVSGVHYTSKFTKTLFVRFDSTPALERLRNSLGLELKATPFDPHVSLLYKTLPAEKQSELAATIHLPFQSVRFDALEIVRCRVAVTTAADVADWETIGVRQFAE